MNNSLVSVVMPVYNAEKYLSYAIKSILDQTYRNIELIIINDGSTDNSLKIIERYKVKDSRVILISRENRGLISSLNEGFEKAKGKYIARMDADDISLDKRIEKQTQFMDKNPEVIASGTWYKTFNKRKRAKRKLNTDNNQLKAKLIFNSPLAHPTVIIRREEIVKYKLKYKHEYFLAEDYEFWFQLSKEGKLGNVSEYLLLYRLHDGQVTNKMETKKLETAGAVRRLILSEYGYHVSDNDLELHNKISYWPTKCDKNFLDRTNKWFLKLKDSNTASFIEDKHYLVLYERWMWVCLNASNKLIGIKYFLFSEFSTSINIFARIKMTIILICRLQYYY